MAIVWCMVPEIWSATDRIFFSFWTIFCPFTRPLWTRKSKFWKNEQHIRRYYHFTNAYHKLQSYDVWFLWYEMQQTEFLVILEHFLSFYPPDNPKNQNFEKLRKKHGDIIILHMCTINDNHMMYGSWDMKRDGQNFLSFWTVFCHFTPLPPPRPSPPNNPKNQNFEKLKKTPRDIIILYMCPINDNQMMYGSWGIERDRQIFLSFWTIFCPFTP